ncbi:MAG TPA: PTS sugar transporter subunit IIA [Anaerolineales bacterium]|nr:PTS sugar transporter subunit IIA [Anaerolineales bacterium]
MIGLVLVCHGKMADGLMDAMQMITGEQAGVRGIGLMETESVEDLTAKIRSAVEEVDSGEGVLILVDLFGASPFNASAGLILASPKRTWELVTGLNLPMLVELVVQRQGLSLPQAVDLVLKAGPEGIRRLSDVKGLEH